MTASSAPDGVASREFPLGDDQFKVLQELARTQVGIELGDNKREMVYGRLVRRLRILGLNGFDAYCELLTNGDPDELGNFVNSITTNVTAFFREPHHFDFLAETAVPALLANRSEPRLRIWSAACSTGQEPYSIAATVASALGTGPEVDWKILATDVDTDAVNRADAGHYPASELPDRAAVGDRARWFSRMADGRIEPVQAIRDRVRFRQLNLMGDWPMRGPLDVIFCRNVTIYFSVETQRRIFTRFAELLAPDGYVMIGHSESLLHSTDLFTQAGRTIYKKCATSD